MAGLRAYWRFVRLAWSTSPGLVAVSAATVVLAALAPLAGVAAIGAVVAEVPRVAAQGVGSTAGRTALWLVIIAGLTFFLQSALAAVQTAVANLVGDRVDSVLQRDLMRAVMAPPGIGHLEDPRVVDLISVGRDTFRAGARRPGRLVATMSGLVAGRIVLFGSGVIVARFYLLLGVTLTAAGLWAAHEDRVASRREAAHHHRSTEAARRTEYFYDLAVTPQAGKEIRVFGLSTFVVDRYFASWQRAVADVLRPAARRPLLASIALSVVILAQLGWIAREAIAGRIDAAGAAVVVQALLVGLAGVRQSSWSGLQSELALATLRQFEDAVSAVRSSPARRIEGRRSAMDLPRSEIRFERVSFAYPGAGGRQALSDLELVIPAGRSLAIVGPNGVGKTTLVKLLCRLYEPTGGRITVDGTDLRDLDVEGWRQRIAAVFQDSTRFALSAATNIGFGRCEAAEADRAGIGRAAETAGISAPLAKLPDGWKTVLSAEFPGGVDLSGGEWQKVGLARALFAVGHGASVLVLDEPAAHLDARAEARIYSQFLGMTEGLTTIVISHRFSTVRQASSIVVLADGRVAEQGSHDELLARGGAYAEMFGLQAARFADTDAGPATAGQLGGG